MENNKVGLIILDGWGIGDKSSSDAIYHAKTPVFDRLMQQYPNATLKACGGAVGLPDGQMGNSEVGHLNIGAGRIVYQELTRINKSISDGDFFKNETLIEAFRHAKEEGRHVHFIGLVSEGGVHSSQEHLHALCDMAGLMGLENVFIHAFTDGRDCDPKSGLQYLTNLEEYIKGTSAKIASIIGRYYAMDRDLRWERVAKAYHLLVNGEGNAFDNVKDVFEASYDKNITDEFITPAILTDQFQPIKDGDLVVSFNFRTDRPREIVAALCQQNFPEWNMHALDIQMVTMTKYDEDFKNLAVIFEKDNLSNTMGEVLAKNGKSQLRVAETEKYPHVTFFFSGGREIPFEGENRILVNSPKVATYDLQPEMSAHEVTKDTITYLKEHQPHFFCLNFANPDMVGHTGVYEAIVKAVETVDGCLGDLLQVSKELDYELIIIADHGNADFAINPDGSPNTAHSLNEVPVIFYTENANKWEVKNGVLADVAPSILKRLSIAVPIEMTGNNLLFYK